MENLKAFFTRRPERLLGRCGMLFLMAFFVMNLSSCNDDFIEDDGGEVIPPEEIVIPPVYMLLDGPYKSGVTLTQNEDSSYTIETTNGDPWATAGLFKEDVPEECNVLEFEYQTHGKVIIPVWIIKIRYISINLTIAKAIKKHYFSHTLSIHLCYKMSRIRYTISVKVNNNFY